MAGLVSNSCDTPEGHLMQSFSGADILLRNLTWARKAQTKRAPWFCCLMVLIL